MKGAQGEKKWWVWVTDYPSDGFVHTKARTSDEAIAKVRAKGWLGEDDPKEDPQELSAELASVMSERFRKHRRDGGTPKEAA